MTRTEALEAAEKFIERQAPTKNDRGYATNSGPALSERVSNVLLVAEWLLESETVEIRNMDGVRVREVEL